METIVVKVDSSSLLTPERIDKLAERILKHRSNGKNTIVVVPSIELLEGKLLPYSSIFTERIADRESHALKAINTQVASSLLAIVLEKKGWKAVSLSGWQAGIEVVKSNGNILIEQIHHDFLLERIHNGEIAIVAGSQGYDQYKDLWTLGEGGPETTAIAIGTVLDAEYVEILTEQDGIYTAESSVVKEARKLKEVTYDEMLELAHLGSTFVHPRAVELAKKYEMPIVVRSSTNDVEGTWIKGEVKMEKNRVVRGVAYEADIIRLTVGFDSYENSSLANIFMTLSKFNIDVDIIVQAVIDGVKPTVSFSIAKEDFAEAIKVLEQNKAQLGFSFADFEVGLAKVSIVGSGMVSNPGVAAQMFDRLRKENIIVKMVSTSEIKVSVVVPQDEMVRAANVLHDEFQLVEEYVN